LICASVFSQAAQRAAVLTAWTAGNNSPIRMAMMAITTKSSINVNPRDDRIPPPF
jgi:hypothetical protein